jgi:cobalamin biosynthesis protein CobT
MDDWADAEVWRLVAEQAYITAFGKVKTAHSENTHEAFAELRYELDQLDMFKARDFEALVALGEEDGEEGEDGCEDENDYEDENNDEDEEKGEDKGEDESEAKDEGAHASVEAGTIDLPIRQRARFQDQPSSSY